MCENCVTVSGIEWDMSEQMRQDPSSLGQMRINLVHSDGVEGVKNRLNNRKMYKIELPAKNTLQRSLLTSSQLTN